MTSPFHKCRGATRIAAFATLFLSLLAAPARSLETRDLAGWWIAIDNTFPALWNRGVIVAMEELLIVAPDGRAENRTFGFWIPSTDNCTQGYACGDAPLIATARLSLKGELLTVGERADTAQRVDSSKSDPLIRRLAITATPTWSVSQADGILILRSVTATETRALARIEPGRLRRLRAGLLASSLSAAGHWRCLLANATASDPAFAPLRTGGHAAPAFLNDYLRAASLQISQQAVPGRGIEHFMIERFENAKLSDAERAVIARVTAETKKRADSTDAEVKKLFCLE